MQESDIEGIRDTVPIVSLIVPVYNEEQSIEAVLEEAIQVLDKLPEPYEFLLVDDGSDNETAEIIRRARQRNSAIRLFTILPNSGQSAAFGVGFRECRGRVAVLMDGDGQNDPHDIPMLLNALKDCDACCGYRALRRDTLWLMQGARIKQMPVNHGPRTAGTSKYTNLGRLKEAIGDLWAVRWMQKRDCRFQVTQARSSA